MKPQIFYRAHYSVPPQAKLFLEYLLANHPTTRTKSIRVEMEAVHRKKLHGNCSGQVFQGQVMDLVRVFTGTKEKPRPTPHVLNTLAHEYCHVLQNDVAIKYGQELCVEADAFAARVVPEFISRYDLKIS